MAKARALFAIEDVYTCRIVANCDKEYEPNKHQEMPVQTRISRAGEAQYYALTTKSGERHFLKYYVDAGLRVLKHGVDPNSEISEEQVLAEIRATFVAKYYIKNEQQPEGELVTAFAENAVYHIWPYWRECAQSAMIRLRLPPLMLPTRFAPSTKEGSDSGAIEQPELE